MLVLTRKKYQKLVISDRGRIVATLTLVEIRGDQVRIGVQAERHIGVDREEVFEAKVADMLRAVGCVQEEQDDDR